MNNTKALEVAQILHNHGYTSDNSVLGKQLMKWVESVCAQLAERDAQLAAIFAMPQELLDKTKEAGGALEMARYIREYQATRQPTQDKKE